MRRLNIRALGLGVVALVLMGAMVWLGMWQLSVYDDHQHADAAARLRQPPVPLTSLLGPDDAFPSAGTGRPVTVSGAFLRADQLYVRHLTGASRGYAVVTPLLTSNGSAVLVVRGAEDHLGSVAPSGQVEVTGILEPSQDGGGAVNAQRVADGLSVSSLVNAVKPDLYSGYVLLRSSSPTQHPSLSPVTPTLPDPSRWSGIRNLLYACQWWVFALFVAFMWWRVTDPQLGGDPAAVEAAGTASSTLTPLR